MEPPKPPSNESKDSKGSGNGSKTRETSIPLEIVIHPPSEPNAANMVVIDNDDEEGVQNNIDEEAEMVRESGRPDPPALYLETRQWDPEPDAQPPYEPASPNYQLRRPSPPLMDPPDSPGTSTSSTTRSIPNYNRIRFFYDRDGIPCYPASSSRGPPKDKDSSDSSASRESQRGLMMKMKHPIKEGDAIIIKEGMASKSTSTTEEDRKPAAVAHPTAPTVEQENSEDDSTHYSTMDPLDRLMRIKLKPDFLERYKKDKALRDATKKASKDTAGNALRENIEDDKNPVLPQVKRELKRKFEDDAQEDRTVAAPVPAIEPAPTPAAIIPLHDSIPDQLGRPQPWALLDSDLIYEFQTARQASAAYGSRRYSGLPGITPECRKVSTIMYNKYHALELLYYKEIKARVNSGALIPKRVIYGGSYRDDEYLEPNFGPPNWPP